MNNKNVFHHITSAELEAETDTLLDEEIAPWLDAFVKDLSRIHPEKCTTVLGKKMLKATIYRIRRGEAKRQGVAA